MLCFFWGAPQGIVQGLLMLFKDHEGKMLLRGANKFEVRNWKVTGETQVERITSVLV